MSAIPVNNSIQNQSPYPDSYYSCQPNGQPWPSLAAITNAAFPTLYRAPGKAVFVQDNRKVQLYVLDMDLQWQKVNVSELAKASVVEGNAGTDDSKFITSLVLKNIINTLITSGQLQGKSAYQLWRDLGYNGSQDEYQLWLKGDGGSNAGFRGQAILSTSPGIPSMEVWYFAATPGTYNSFLDASNNPITVNGSDGLCVLSYVGGYWTKMSIPTQEVVNDLTTGGVSKALSAEMGKKINETTGNLHTNPDGSFALVDSNGVPCLQVSATGDIEFYNGFKVDELNVSKLNGAGFEQTSTDFFVFASHNGVPIFEIRNGRFIGGIPNQDFGEIEIHIQYGQSNSVGAGGSPVLHSAAPSDKVLSFIRNGYNYVEPVTGLYDGGSVVYDGWGPCLESNFETGVTAMGNMLKQAWLAEGYDIDQTETKILTYAPGTSGEEIKMFVPGTGNYTRMLNGVVNAVRIAADMGLTCVVKSVTWIQGESDYWARNGADYYEAQLNHISHCANVAFKALTGQKQDAKWLLWQFVSQNERYIDNYAGRFDIPLRMLEMARNYPDRYVLAHAPYWLPYADNLHLNAVGHATCGAIQGLILSKLDTWKGLDVIDHSYMSNLAFLRFSVPYGQLKFDTATVTNPGNYGFKLWNSFNVEKAIVSVKIASRDSVKIVAALPIQKGDYITYGMYTAPEPPVGTGSGFAGTGPVSGNRGCLRDTQGDHITYDVAGTTLPLHNFCPLFKLKF